MAWSYERFELEDVRLFKTADFDCSRSGNLRTVFGTRLRLLFAIGSGLRCRGEKHDPVPDLLTSSAFTGTDRVCFGRFWVRGLPFPNARHLGHPFQWKNTLPWHLGPAAKVRILRFKNLPPFRHDPGLQIPCLRYSPGLAPTTRLNALLNAASDS